MSAAAIVRDWRRCVAEQLLPDLHGHQARALADFRYAALAGHCQAGQLAGHTPTLAPRPGARWLGEAEAFKKAGGGPTWWRPGSAAAAGRGCC
jgi:hypothetical protein